MKRWVFPIAMIVVGVFSIAALCFANLSGSLEEKQILIRIQPEGEVTVEAGSGQEVPPKTAVTAEIGQQKYEQFCHICHATGVAGAPKFGDKGEWAPRIAQGIDMLVKHALEGYKAMPPKGTCTNCTDEEMKKAVEYMVSQAK